ncbi:uncharacterized protein LOC114297573 [Camellia sinensis]|uniref:uncharacterized protein LOC114297573 n=1 Tax=Camellia sinensis TaxID=4442 RepID=UPI001035E7C8|nr:uncharacterized protein LOC114297573 [Camellia sinensis]
MWLCEAECEDIVKAMWNRDNNLSGMELVLSKVATATSGLQDWNWRVLGNVQRQIQMKMPFLQQLQAQQSLLDNDMIEQKVLNEVVSPTQSAFVLGRAINDNVFMAFEVFHYLKNKMRDKVGYFALKLDMSKPYDWVEWEFVKALSALIHQAKAENLILGILIGRGCQRLSHLFFNDDSLLFVEASDQVVDYICSTLQKYEATFGKKVNFEKSGICCSKNVGIEELNRISALFGVGQLVRDGKYLGMSFFVGWSKNTVFNHIKDRVWKCFNRWKEKSLSAAGREVLTKAVAYTIPIYIMSCFQLPEDLCHAISALIARFWLGQKEEEQNSLA